MGRKENVKTEFEKGTKPHTKPGEIPGNSNPVGNLHPTDGYLTFTGPKQFPHLS